MNTTIAWGDIPGWLRIAVIGLALVQVSVAIYALVRLLKTPEDRLVFGKRWPWVLIILFVNLIGAIVFLAAGRTPAPATDPLAGAPSGDSGPFAPGERAARAADVLYGREDGDGA